MADITITAKFDGECPVCGQATRKGQRISKHGGEWMHEGCVARYESERAGLLAEIARYNPAQVSACERNNLNLDGIRYTLRHLEESARFLGKTAEEYRVSLGL